MQLPLHCIHCHRRKRKYAAFTATDAGATALLVPMHLRPADVLAMQLPLHCIHCHRRKRAVDLL